MLFKTSVIVILAESHLPVSLPEEHLPGKPEMTDTDRLLDLIEEGVVEHGGDLGG